MLSLTVGASYAQSFELVSEFDDMCDLQDANGVTVADYDLDGDLDVFVVSIHRYEVGNDQTWSRLLRNDGEDGFKDVTDESLLRDQNESIRTGWMGDRMGASWGDYDNDGYPDLFLANNGNDALWRNKGNGQFENVTKVSGVQGCPDCYSSNGLWWDYDLDGDLDLYVSDWLRVNRQYRNEGDGTFTDVSVSTGLNDTSKTWTSLPIDINKDTFPDLYVVNDFGDNFLFMNNGRGEFHEATKEYGLEDDGDGMGVDICDCNNDGNFDIYVTNIYRHRPNPFFVGSGEGLFNELAKDLGIENTGWGWGARFFDANHDMDEDLYVVNGMNLSAGRGDRNVFFENKEGSFHNVANGLGLDNATEARGLEVFDYDLDGDIDMLVANRGDHPSFYKNMLMESEKDDANWIQIWLEGTTSNKNGLGSVVSISCQGQKYIRHHSGTNLFGQSIKPVHFGLAHHTAVDEIEVTWPNGTKEYFTGIESNQMVRLVEGTGETETIVVVGIDNESIEAFKVFPNPFKNEINITTGGKDLHWMEFSMVDISGRQVYYEKRSVEGNVNTNIQLHDSGIRSGLYFYSVITPAGKKTGTLIKG